MGFTRYFMTPDTEEAELMTLDEVRAGVAAIKAVAECRRDEFLIDQLTETSILVNVRSENPVESLAFRPTKIRDNEWLLFFNHCKTNEYPEDDGIREMLEALQAAVNNKIVLC